MTMRQMLERDFLARHREMVRRCWEEREESEARIYLRRSLRKLKEFRDFGILQVY